MLLAAILCAFATVLFNSKGIAQSTDCLDGENGAALLALDYSELVDSCRRLGWDEDFGSRSFRYKEILVDDLTEAEQAFLSCYEDEDGWRFGTAITALNIVTFCRQQGHFPAGGAELISQRCYQPQSAEAIEEILSGDASSLAKIGYGINPATGRLYESFSDDSPRPFSISVSRGEGENATKLIPYSYTDENGEKQATMKEYDAWHIIIYGESADRVLIDKYIWTDPDDVS